MSLISGPGRGGASTDSVPAELKLVVDNHVKYIQSLDKVRHLSLLQPQFLKLMG